MNRFPRLSRLMWLIGLITLVVSVTGAGWLLNSSEPSAPSGQADPRDLGVVCFGYVDVPEGITSLYPVQPGRVVRVLVHEGDVVAAGAVLIHLDDQLARSQVEEARVAVDAAELQLTEALKQPQQLHSQLAQQEAAIEAVRIDLAYAHQELEGKKAALKEQTISELAYARLQAQVKKLEVALRVEQEKLTELQLRDPSLTVQRAEKEVSRCRALLAQAQRNLDECDLKAPQAGTVLRVQAPVGELLSGPPRQPAVLFCPDGPRIIRIEVEQEFAGQVVAGHSALIEDDVRGGQTWRGRVLRPADWYMQRRMILQDPSQLQDVRTVECLIELEPGQAPLRIGQRMRVTIGRTSP
jgi:multidrug resistance efflux pump